MKLQIENWWTPTCSVVAGNTSTSAPNKINKWTHPKQMIVIIFLKEKLAQALVLTFPQFDKDAEPFVLQTNASAVGLGAILKQGNHVVAYASRAFTKPECQYTV